MGDLHDVSVDILGEIRTARIEALGWAWAEACNMLDHDIDPRKVEMPEVLARMKEAFDTPS